MHDFLCEWLSMWMATLMTFYVNGDNVTYLNSSGVAYIPIEILKFIDVKNITTNIYRTHWA